MSKGLFEKVIERAFLNAAGVWGRKAANTLAEKAQTKLTERNVAQKTKKKATSVDENEPSDKSGDIEMID